jgi:hypothetical protein
LAQATPSELKQFFHAVLQHVYVENKEVVAIRPKPIYDNLMCMPPADPTGVQDAGDIQILGAQDELAGTIRGDTTAPNESPSLT